MSLPDTSPTGDEGFMLNDVPIVEVVIEEEPPKTTATARMSKAQMATTPSEDQLFRPSIELSGLQSSIDNLNALTIEPTDHSPLSLPSFINHLNQRVEKSKSRYRTSNVPAPVLFMLESYERSAEFVWNTLEQDLHTFVCTLIQLTL
jgi:hypothetical protein